MQKQKQLHTKTRIPMKKIVCALAVVALQSAANAEDVSKFFQTTPTAPPPPPTLPSPATTLPSNVIPVPGGGVQVTVPINNNSAGSVVVYPNQKAGGVGFGTRF